MPNKNANGKRYIPNSLFWRIALLLFFILAVIGLSYVYITVQYSGIYSQHINQVLNRSVAANIVATSKPFLDKEVNEPALEDIFHSVMAVNPGLEVYLLDEKGKILSYFPPQKKILLRSVDLKPIHEFMRSNGKEIVTGDDPRDPRNEKIFSAAPIYSKGLLSGYMYVVLASEEYDKISSVLKENFLVQIGARAMILTLLTGFIIGLVIIRLITRNLTRILDVMQQFRQGDLSARISTNATGDFRELAEIFNEMADILTANVEKLKAVEVLRRELIANVSHDLRTPIAIIHGYIETLQMKQETLTPEDRKRYMNIVLESTEKLKNLVDELFELSKLEAKQVQLKRELFDISELASDITGKYQLIARQKNIFLETALSPNLPRVFADISLIERVIQNLLDNALKFTPAAGKVIIETQRKSDRVAVTVSDTGSGIPEKERKNILGRYYTAGTASDPKGNTGLGLAIVEKILGLHESGLEVTSDESRGSTFEFTLPLYDRTEN